jgi:hypothetical protein
MRRLLASLLLVLISLSLASPLLASAARSSVPACCLRGGKHHCAMGTPASSNGNPALRADCPFLQHGSLAASSSQKSSVAAAVTASPALFNARSLESLPHPRFIQRRIAAHGDRGPPSHFA